MDKEVQQHFTAHLPEHMREGLRAYLDERRPTGGFLRAVLANDFHGATVRADPQNGMCLREWAELLPLIPHEAWGSYEKVDAWCNRKAGEGA